MLDNGNIPDGYDFRPLWDKMHEEQVYKNRCKAQRKRRAREKQQKLAEEYKAQYEAKRKLCAKLKKEVFSDLQDIHKVEKDL